MLLHENGINPIITVFDAYSETATSEFRMIPPFMRLVMNYCLAIVIQLYVM